MAQIETWLKSDLDNMIQVQDLTGAFFDYDSKGNLIGVEVTDGGRPVTLTGTVFGYVIKSDGNTLKIPGSITGGNKAYFVMTQEAYKVGPISIVIKLAYSDTLTTLAAATGYVHSSKLGTEVVPSGTPIPSLESLEEAIRNANAAAAQINNMDGEVSGLPYGSAPTIQITDVNGHKHIALGIPQGAPGNVNIDDTAGSGDTNKTWSANKLVTEYAKYVPTTRKVNGHALSGNVTVTKGDVGLGNADNTSDADKPVSTAMQAALDGKISTTLKGAANGVAELDANGMVPSAQLPSYVDDVLEYANKASFPATGESGKIYVALDTNLTWRWSGSAYVEISKSLALGETDSTAYRGDRGKTAYTHATDANRLTTAQTEGLYKIATTEHGHVKSVSPVVKQDILDLGITSDIIDDTAGAGDTNKAWSADKVLEELEHYPKTDKLPDYLSTPYEMTGLMLVRYGSYTDEKRLRAFTDLTSAITAITQDGFASTTDTYKTVTAYFAQSPAPKKLLLSYYPATETPAQALSAVIAINDDFYGISLGGSETDANVLGLDNAVAALDRKRMLFVSCFGMVIEVVAEGSVARTLYERGHDSTISVYAGYSADDSFAGAVLGKAMGLGLYGAIEDSLKGPIAGITPTSLSDSNKTSLRGIRCNYIIDTGLEDGVTEGGKRYDQALLADAKADQTFGKRIIPDISGKADKVSGPTAGDVATLDSNGNPVDSGKTLGVSVPADAKFTDTIACAYWQSTQVNFIGGNARYNLKADFTNYYPRSGNVFVIVLKENLTFDLVSGYSGITLVLTVNNQGATLYVDGNSSFTSSFTLNKGVYWVYYRNSTYYLRTDGFATYKINGFTLEKSVPSDAVFTDTTYDPATQSTDGLMSSTDKTKLDGMEIATTTETQAIIDEYGVSA